MEEQKVDNSPGPSLGSLIDYFCKNDGCNVSPKDHDDSYSEALAARLSRPTPPGEVFAQEASGSLQTTKLCSKCRAIFEAWPYAFNSQGLTSVCQHHETPLDLQKAADEGCTLCSQFRRCIPSEQWEVALGVLDVWLLAGCKPLAGNITVENYEDNGQFTITLRFNRPKYGFQGLNNFNDFRDDASIMMQPWSPSHHALDRFGDLGPSTRDSIPLIRQWYEQCQLDHQICRSRSSKFLPTRLIYLGGPHPILQISDQIQGCPDYATLSHCWGKVKFTTLKSDNLDEFRSRIPPDAISKTFGDTFHVLAQMGIDFVWIDSLCIVQDDVMDWKKESVQMSEIYGRSSLNIAVSSLLHLAPIQADIEYATSAADGSEGLFNERMSSPRSSVIIPRNPSTGFICARSNNYRSAFHNMPLVTRAWTAQERILPPRTVHFTRTEVFWECHSSMACESIPSGYSFNKMENRDNSLFVKKKLHRDMWNTIVCQYSKMSLTFWEDRPIAISGIVKKILDETGEQYLAGIWRDNFLADMLWSTVPNSNLPRPETSLAPSWPWLSIQGEIEPDHIDHKNQQETWMVEIMDVNLVPPNSLHQFNAGVVRLKCLGMLKAICSEHRSLTMTSKHKNAFNRKKTLFFNIQPDCSDWKPRGQDSNQVIYLIPLYGHSHNFASHSLWGLVLVRHEEKGQGCYLRVGTYTQFRQTSIISRAENTNFDSTLAPYTWSNPDNEWDTPRVTAEDFVRTEMKDGKEWGIIEIH